MSFDVKKWLMEDKISHRQGKYDYENIYNSCSNSCKLERKTLNKASLLKYKILVISAS